jgi:hypothetical protein
LSAHFRYWQRKKRLIYQGINEYGERDVSMLRCRSSLVLRLSLDKYAGMHNYQALPEQQKWLG